MLESRESASPILTRSVNAVLSGHSIFHYKFSAFERFALWSLGAFPQSLALSIIPRFQATNALTKIKASSIKISELIQERLNDYIGLKGKFDSMIIGVGLGGATGHIAAAINAPFLPQAFVLTIQGGSATADVNEYYQQGRGVANRILENNLNAFAIQHFDPVHDGWLTRSVNHIRLKLIKLPEQYKQFIHKHLKPGGTILYLEGNVPWQQFQTSHRSVFQVGGWGDISDQEFINGSSRLTTYCTNNGLTTKGWKLPRFPLVTGFESEWGSETGLKKDLQTFCTTSGFKLEAISFTHPFEISNLAFKTTAELYKKNQITATGTLIEMFSQYDLDSTIRAGLLPVWLVFNTADNIRDLRKIIDQIETEKPVLFAGLATFSLTPDMADYYTWASLFRIFKMINIGARKSHYPADTRALLSWNKTIKALAFKHNHKIKKYLCSAEIIEIFRQINKEPKC